MSKETQPKYSDAGKGDKPRFYPDNKYRDNYDKIFREFHKNKIAVMLHYFPIHLHPFYKKKGFKNGDFPMTENYAKRSFSIPIYPSMSFSQQSKVISIIKKVYKKFL